MITPLFFLSLFHVANVVSSFRMSNTSGQVIVLILMVGSVFAWSIMLTKFAELKAAFRSAERFQVAYKNSRHPLALYVGGAKHPFSPLSAVYEDICRNVMRAAKIQEGEAVRLQHEGFNGVLKEYQIKGVRNLSDQVLAERMLDLEKHMGILATAANAAPFLGLLGTVWGVMDAFGGLGIAGAATMSAVAPGVSGALLTTVVGLVVALPSMIGYNMLVGRIRRLTLITERFMQELMGDIERQFLGG